MIVVAFLCGISMSISLSFQYVYMGIYTRGRDTHLFVLFEYHIRFFCIKAADFFFVIDKVLQNKTKILSIYFFFYIYNVYFAFSSIFFVFFVFHIQFSSHTYIHKLNCSICLSVSTILCSCLLVRSQNAYFFFRLNTFVWTHWYVKGLLLTEFDGSVVWAERCENERKKRTTVNKNSIEQIVSEHG